MDVLDRADLPFPRKTKLPLKLHGGHAGRLTGDQISGPEPDVQRSVATLHHCSHRQPGVLGFAAEIPTAACFIVLVPVIPVVGVSAGENNSGVAVIIGNSAYQGGLANFVPSEAPPAD